MSIAAPVVETQDPAVLAQWYTLFLGFCPEFTSAASYPLALVNAWIPAAVAQINQSRFGSQYNLAVCLYIAHQVTLSAREIQTTAPGTALAGEAYGPIASKSIDKLSISYGTMGTVDGAGAYNQTSYGIRLFELIRSYASGPIYTPFRGRRR